MQNDILSACINAVNAVLLDNTSSDLFNKALSAGHNHRFINMLLRRSSRLPELGSCQLHMKNARYGGLRDVAVNDVRGTEGHQNDFDDRFYPLTDRIRQRWQGIARAFQSGMELPPVELIQVGEVYFVRDGHHRVSVSRALGRTTIIAIVTVW